MISECRQRERLQPPRRASPYCADSCHKQQNHQDTGSDFTHIKSMYANGRDGEAGKRLEGAHIRSPYLSPKDSLNFGGFCYVAV